MTLVNVAENSRDSYGHAVRSGIERTETTIIRDWCEVNKGGLTRKMIARTTGLELTNVCARVNKMIKDGVLFEVENPDRKCAVTGRKAKWVFAAKDRNQLSLL